MTFARASRSYFVRSLITLVISACGGPGSGVIGIATTGGSGGTGGGPAVLSFSGQPNGGTVGQIMSAVGVVVSDSLGQLDTTFTSAVTIAFGSNPTAAALGGTTTVRAASGIATFTNLTIDKAGSYTLVASASGATSVTSSAFTVNAVTGP